MLGSSHVLSSRDHKALGEDADVATTVTLQPGLVHFTQDVHDVPPLQGQVLGPPGTVAVLGHHLVEGSSAACSLWPALKLQNPSAGRRVPPGPLQCLLPGEGDPAPLVAGVLVTAKRLLRVASSGRGVLLAGADL